MYAGLLQLHEQLAHSGSAKKLAEINGEAERELQQWSERSADYLKLKASEVKELMLLLARTAETVAARDQTYGQEFSGFSEQLEAVADLEDLSKIRVSLKRSVSDLNNCVERLNRDSQQAVAQLKAELSTAQARLEQSEKIAVSDALTGLANRRKVELELEARCGERKQHCVILLDLNEFKQINDKYGHSAGDDVLKQFADELKAVFRPTDTVGRWGGDEFVVILDCDLAKAKSQLPRLAEWVFGEYNIHDQGGMRKVKISAAVGIAEAAGGEAPHALVARADAAMYRDKGNREGARR
ncbi:MAG: GGDEF domain-containing protein [Bryobacteraceae bacterium]